MIRLTSWIWLISTCYVNVYVAEIGRNDTKDRLDQHAFGTTLRANMFFSSRST
jgi:hypothetical protein